MSSVAQKQDLSDPEVVRRFAGVVAPNGGWSRSTC